MVPVGPSAGRSGRRANLLEITIVELLYTEWLSNLTEGETRPCGNFVPFDASDRRDTLAGMRRGTARGGRCGDVSLGCRDERASRFDSKLADISGKK